MKRKALVELLMQIPADADVRVENCMIHDGELAVREVAELRSYRTGERLLNEEKNESLPYWLLYGEVGP